MFLAPPPPISWVKAGMAKAGATEIRCIKPNRTAFICAGTYSGWCTEFVATWTGSKLVIQPLRRIHKPCAPLPGEVHGPAA